MAGPRILSLFSGIGGLDAGVKLAIPSSQVVGYCERDAYAAAVLVARMEDEALDRAPVWTGDIRDLDARPLRGHVDMVIGGYPCQPFSVAGKRKGYADERHLWPEVYRIIQECDPAIVFCENVAGHVRLGFADVLADFAAIGFDAEWCCFRASDVGAPHRRERLFILAYGKGGRRRKRGASGCKGNGGHADGGDQVMAHGNTTGRQQLGSVGLLNGQREARGNDVDGCGEAVGYTTGIRRNGHTTIRRGAETCKKQRRVRQSEGRGFPPPPDDLEGWQRWIAAGGPQPAVRRDADGTRYRLDRLRCLGNAVVPQQAAYALTHLLGRMEEP